MSKRIKLILILIFAFFIRTYHISLIPPSLFSDEVDILYQARSFKEKGTDYFGHKFPIHFQSLSDWRTPLQIYSSALISVFTDNEFVIVRLPSAIFSTLTIFIIYLLTNSLITAFIFTINPWSIHYGRTGFEVSGMLFCLLTGFYFIKKFLSKNKTYFLLLSSFFFILSAYFYSTSKLFLVLIFPILFIYFLKNRLLSLKSVIFTSIGSFIFLLPLILSTLSGQAGFRFSYISIFTEPKREQVVDTLRYQDILLTHPGEIGVKTSVLSKLLHNKYQLIWDRFLKNYFNSFSSTFLFVTGDLNLRHGFGEHGLLYIFEFFTVIYGIILYRSKPNLLGHLFLLLLILSPIPFALTRDSTSAHATRLILMLPSLIYFSSQTVTRYKFILFFFFIFFIQFIDFYQNHYPQNSATNWHQNMSEVVKLSQNSDVNQYYFSDSYEPFLPFFLVYYPYPTASLPLILNREDTPYFFGYSIDHKYFFGRINWSSIESLPNNSFLIVPDSEINQTPTSLLKLFQTKKTYLNSVDFSIFKK